MLGLPSTTEVDRVLPKRAFYEHLQLDPATRRSFVDDIESITVRNSIKPPTTGIPAGDAVQEVLVLEVALKGATVPKAALAAIARSNPRLHQGREGVPRGASREPRRGTVAGRRRAHAQARPCGHGPYLGPYGVEGGLRRRGAFWRDRRAAPRHGRERLPA